MLNDIGGAGSRCYKIIVVALLFFKLIVLSTYLGHWFVVDRGLRKLSVRSITRENLCNLYRSRSHIIRFTLFRCHPMNKPEVWNEKPCSPQTKRRSNDLRKFMTRGAPRPSQTGETATATATESLARAAPCSFLPAISSRPSLTSFGW